jgi:pimeloyl-ACP methyl ester carboxylesterase
MDEYFLGGEMLKKSYIRMVTAVLVASGLIFFLVSALFFSVLRMTLGHHAGNQCRRGAVRTFLQQVYGAESVVFSAEDGTLLAGLLIRRQGAEGTVILCHGYRHSKEQMARYVGLFAQMNILMFDFRAFGESGGCFSSIGYYESRDVRAAVEYVKNVIPQEERSPLLLLGISMGAAAVLKAATENDEGIHGLIVDSPYASLAEILDQAAHHFSCIPRGVLRRMVAWVEYVVGPLLQMSPAQYVKRLQVPVFFIHAITDSVTHAGHSVRLFRKMYKRQQALSWLWLTPPAKHALCYLSYPKHYQMRIARFIQAIKHRMA